MNDPISHLYVLHTNPFLFATTLHSFYERLGPRQHSLLLAYLVLPIVLDERNRRFLLKAKSTSNLRTMLAHPGRMRALPGRLAEYRSVTNATLRYLIGSRMLQVKGTVVLPSEGSEDMVDPIAPEGASVAARKLADFFQPFDVPTIYRMLGVLQL